MSELYRKLGVTETTFYRWMKRFGSLGVPELRELRQLRATWVDHFPLNKPSKNWATFAQHTARNIIRRKCEMSDHVVGFSNARTVQ